LEFYVLVLILRLAVYTLFGKNKIKFGAGAQAILDDLSLIRSQKLLDSRAKAGA